MTRFPRRTSSYRVAARPLLVALLALLALVAGCGRASPTPDLAAAPSTASATSGPSAAGRSPASTPPTPPASTATPSPTPLPAMPAFRHIYVVVMENKDFGSIVGSPTAPYINSLVARYALATNYHAVARPSQPNYLALFSGSTHGVQDDFVHDISAPNLADQLESHGRTWRLYAQNVPSGCFVGAAATGGPDGSGTYARKHNPAISFTDISGNPARCANIRPFGDFDPAATDFAMIIPNLCNDMHDCSVKVGDRFLRSFVPRITSSPAFADSALFIVWDEPEGLGAAGGPIAAVVVSPLVSPGSTFSERYDHYSILRSIEDAWSLGCLAQACSASDMAALFPG